MLDSALLWARSRRLFLGVAFLYGMIDRKTSPIDPVLRSLVTVRVSQLNGCRFCVDLNSATLLQRGTDLKKVEARENWRQSTLFSETERIALEYAEAVTLRSNAIDDDLIQRLRHFDEDTIVELTALIAFQDLSSKFNSALGVPPQGFCGIPAHEHPEAAGVVASPRSACSVDGFPQVGFLIQLIDLHPFEIAPRDDTQDPSRRPPEDDGSGDCSSLQRVYCAAIGKCIVTGVGRHCLRQRGYLGTLVFGKRTHRVTAGENADQAVLIVDYQHRAGATLAHAPARFLHRIALL